MVHHVIPEQRLHIASCFVSAVSIIIAVHHIAFAQRNPARTPILRHERLHDKILSFRVGISIILTAVTFGEFAYQLDNRFYPDPPSRVLFYTDQILSIATWAANAVLTIIVARNGAWLYFTLLDHFLTVTAWCFLFSIEAIRFQQFVFVHVKSTSEQLTTTVILAASLCYFVTVMGTVVIVLLKRKERPSVRYDELSGPESGRRVLGTENRSGSPVERVQVVEVHRAYDAIGD